MKKQKKTKLFFANLLQQKGLYVGLLSAFAVSQSCFAQENPLWMRYPSISPDGQTIVFSHKGDLYKVPAAGGTAVPLTLHEGHDYMPVWSKDGKQIAFASDRYGNFDVFVMPATGGEPKRLTYFSGNDFPYDFSTDNQNIIFRSSRRYTHTNSQFPRMAQLYSVPVAGGHAKMLLDVQAEAAQYNSNGSKIVYHDWKGYEDDWRKHHTSAVTRDVWVYDVASQKYTQITSFNGEDRNPIFAQNENEIYYLSEKSGDFNIWKTSLENTGQPTQITNFTKHPVRFLSKANNGTLCFGWNGEVYTTKEGSTPQKVNIQVFADSRINTEKIVPINGGATEFSLSPNGKEIAFIFRGEVFVTSADGSVTKRITNTPEQERTVNFSPDGKTLVYAAERNNNWNVYKTSIVRKEEPYFYASTVLKEEPVVATNAEEFQPYFSPDGKEIAYLEERTTLKIYNLATQQSRTVLAGTFNYSYSDGDQYYQWSPDSKWLLASYIPKGGQMFLSEVGLVAADGKAAPLNLTQSGYGDNYPKWAMEGKMMIWSSDRDGMKNHGSWGGEDDIYGMFFTQEAFDRFKLSKEDFDLLKEEENKAKEGEKKDDKKKDETNKEVTPLVFDLKDLDLRKVRLTLHSARLSDHVLSKDGEKLYYLANYEKGTDLWVTDLRTKDVKLLCKDAGNGLELSKDGKFLVTIYNGNLSKIDVETGKKEGIGVKAEMNLNYTAEKAYIFDHAWRQVVKKFYVTNLHNVDWNFYYKEYKRFLPYINNNHDFAEMLSEMLGELNASHTGCRYSMPQQNVDMTASLGIFLDESYTGNGLKISEIIAKSPLNTAKSKIKEGFVIEKIDGVAITPAIDFYQLLNRKEDKWVLLSVLDPATNSRFEETVKPIARWQENELLYRRWVENRRKETEKVSNGKVGYVHVRGMNDASYRTVVDEVLGKNYDKDALIVDTRFNGGGWLHDDLATFLSGKKYMDMIPREQKMGLEPMKKWTKPTNILVGESNYSDAHLFPVTFKAYGIGKAVGMPVPGTGTAVWWEAQIDPTLVFGIPQVGMMSLDGKYMENTQFEPDIKVKNEPEILTNGKDQQIEKAVQDLLQKTN